MSHHAVLRVIAKLMIPFILLFALYVQFHGDFGPGGGFQAGVIFAAGIILYGLIYGVETATRVIPAQALRIGICMGVLLLLLGFLLVTSPTSTHALAQAALHGNLKPLLGRRRP